jgi:hypothetical protein
MRISGKQLRFFAFSFACASFLMAGCSGGNIHTAAFDGDLAKVKQLVAGGVDINHRDKKKVTPLHNAAYQGNTRHIAMVDVHAAGHQLLHLGQVAIKRSGVDVSTAASCHQ